MRKATIIRRADPRSQGRSARRRPTTPALADLSRRLRELPDLRFEKVVSVRQALSDGTYDADALIDALVRRMENDIGVLCRQNGD